MQRVDPFIPVSHTAKPKAPRLQLVRSRPHAAARVQRSVDVFVPQPAVQSPPASISQQTAPAAVALPLSAVQTPVISRHWLRDVLRNAALVVVTLTVGVFAQTLAIGEALIGAYAIYALVRRVASRTTFLLALVSIGVVVLMHVMNKGAALATNFAVYAFLFACIGVITLAREVRSK